METTSAVKAWIKRKDGPGEIVQIVLDESKIGRVKSFKLYTAFDERPDYLGRILFDAQGYWIYDGETLTVGEQEQVGRFIVKYINANKPDGYVLR